MELQFAKVNRFIPFLMILGIALGFAEIFMGSSYNNIQVILVHILTTFLIGYSMLVILLNHNSLFSTLSNIWFKYFVWMILLIIVALVASEIEVIFRTVVFDNKPYQFLSGGNIYLLNAIVTTAVGIGSYLSINFEWPKKDILQEDKPASDKTPETEPITQIPIKQGENIVLLAVDEVAFIEAYDNYSMVYDLSGRKQLSDYSLIFLESRLNRNFIRIHRKHIINKNQIAKIQSHLNGRYVIEMKNDKKVMSSKSYAPLIKSMIKLN